MKKHILFLCLVLASIAFATAQVNNQALIEQYNQNIKSSSNISFEENKGQVKDQHWQPRPEVLFSGESNGLVYHMRENGISYQLSRVESWKEEDDHFGLPKIDSIESRMIPDQIGIYRVDLNWLNANQNCEVVRGKALYGYTNYYNVPDGVEPALNVLKYEDIIFKNVWKGVDLHYFSRDGVLESDWLIERAEDYDQIRFEVKGAELSIDEEGYLVLMTPFGEIREGKLKVYQDGREIQAEWVLNGSSVSFKVIDFEVGKPLRIDPPTRIWGTYYGGNSYDFGMSCVVDVMGSVFLSGYTWSTNNVATTGANQITNAGQCDVFLAKFDANGVRQWGTYYGGDSVDYAMNSAVDASGAVYVSGLTKSAYNIATSAAHQLTHGGIDMGDAFLVKFHSSGIKLWGTYYGGIEWENGTSCAVDQSGNVYLAGYTSSTSNIAATGAHQSNYGGAEDAFLVKFDSIGVRLWGTYYGGNQGDYGLSCETDPSGNVYLAGKTTSLYNISTSGAHQATHGQYPFFEDAFLVKFDASGIRLWGTYYGGNGQDVGYSCAVDISANVYLAGVAESTDNISTPGAHQIAHGGGDQFLIDGFLVKFDSNGVRLWGTYYGGGMNDGVRSCAVDILGNVYISGGTNSLYNIATRGSHQSQLDVGGGIYQAQDGFLIKFDTDGVRKYGTYYGGSMSDFCGFTAVDVSGNVYTTGVTWSINNIATTGGHQTNNGGLSDAFLVKFNIGTTGVINPNSVFQLSIYPNPAKNQITIQLSSMLTDATHSFHDILGRKVLSGNLTSEETKVDISELSSGIYLLTIVSESQKIRNSFKLVVE